MHSGDIPTETVIYPLYQCCFPCCFPCFPAHGWLMMQDIKTSPDYHPDHRISILGAANQCFKLRHGWPSHLDQLEAGLPSRFAGSPKSCKDPKSRASKRKIWADRAGVDKASAPGHEIPSWDPSRLLKKLLDIMPHTATAQSQKSKMPKVLQKDKRYRMRLGETLQMGLKTCCFEVLPLLDLPQLELYTGIWHCWPGSTTSSETLTLRLATADWRTGRSALASVMRSGSNLQAKGLRARANCVRATNYPLCKRKYTQQYDNIITSPWLEDSNCRML